MSEQGFADAYKDLLYYMKVGLQIMDDELMEATHKASLRWKRIGSKCKLCLKTQDDHENTRVYRKLMQTKRDFQRAFGLNENTDEGMHLVFQTE